MTGAFLYVLFIFATLYLGAASLPLGPLALLDLAGLLVCMRVGGHVDRT